MRLYIGIRIPATALTVMTATVATPLGGQSPAVRIHAEATGPTTVGDPITVVVSIEHASDAVVAWPDSLSGIDPFEFESLETTTTSSDGANRVSAAARIVVRAFETGDLTFPQLSVPLLSARGDTTTITTTELPILVQSVGLDESSDIRGIKPPLTIPLSLITVAIWITIIAAVIAMLWFGYKKLRRGPAVSAPVAPNQTTLPPHALALQALDALERSDLLERGDIKEWYVRASAIVRVYIEGRYRISAMELPSGDILQRLEPLRLEYSVLDQFRDFFGRADLVKFAKHRPTSEQCRALIISARKLVDITMEDPAHVDETSSPEAAVA